MTDNAVLTVQELARQLLREVHVRSETDALLAALHLLARAGRDRTASVAAGTGQA